MLLRVGQPAPSFTALDIQGRPFALSQYRGSVTLISFFRSASCPLCSLRLWYMNQRYDFFRQQGLQVVGIFETTEATTAKYAGSQYPSFPLIADPQLRLFHLYEVQSSLTGLVRGLPRYLSAIFEARRKKIGGGMSDGNHTQLPADFLLDNQHIIRVAHYAKSIADHIPFADVEAFLAKNQITLPRR